MPVEIEGNSVFGRSKPGVLSFRLPVRWPRSDREIRGVLNRYMIVELVVCK
jgi:hypothetical protein